jgi:hypothetical protein
MDKMNTFPKFATNQIVRGIKAGHFVVLGYQSVGGEQMVRIKEVNPKNFAQVARGELCLPEDRLLPIH